MAQSNVVKVCPHCGQTPADQHSTTRGGVCDGIRSGKLVKVDADSSTVIARVHDTGELVTYGNPHSAKAEVSE